MLVRRFLTNVFLNTSASSTNGVTSIQNVDHDIRRVDNLVQLVPDTLTLTLGEDGLTSGGEGGLFDGTDITGDDGCTIIVGALV
jgi:hypothetical protein